MKTKTKKLTFLRKIAHKVKLARRATFVKIVTSLIFCRKNQKYMKEHIVKLKLKTEENAGLSSSTTESK